MSRNRFDWHEDVQRLGERFDDFFDRLVDLAGRPRNSFQQSWRPAVDVFERGDGLTVIVELPGVEEANCQVTVEPGRLRIAGVRRPPTIEGSTGPLQLEIEYGPFERTIALPPGVDPEHTVAQFDRGLMRVHVPRTRAKPVHVRVEGTHNDE